MPFLTTDSRTTVRQKLEESFSLDELHTLCASLGLDWENVPGDTKQAKARELLLQLNCAERAPDLLKQCNAERPGLDWSVEWTDKRPAECYMPRNPMVALLALMVVGVAVVILIAAQVLKPEPIGPKVMQGNYNIAVAEFAQADEQGRLSGSDQGEKLSGQVYKALVNERQQYQQINPDAVIEIWHDSMPPSEKGALIGYMGDSLAAQDSAVITAAHSISANLMIYGSVSPQGGFLPQFFVPPNFRGSSEFIGRYRLGDEPINVTSGAQSEDLTTRTNAVFWMARGLDYDGQGEQAKALEAFREAEGKLVNWIGKAQGKEILYFFIGQAALYLAQRQGLSAQEADSRIIEAESAFSQSLAINPEFIRSLIGLGSVHQLRAQKELQKSTAVDPALINAMWHPYREAERLAPQSSDNLWANGVLRLAIGQGYYLEGRIAFKNGRFAEAEKMYEQAAQEVTNGLPALAADKAYRQLGNAYQSIGAIFGETAKAQEQQVKVEEGKRSYERAIAAFEQCIAQGKNEPADRTLTGLIVPLCDKQKNDAAGSLQKLSGG